MSLYCVSRISLADSNAQLLFSRWQGEANSLFFLQLCFMKIGNQRTDKMLHTHDGVAGLKLAGLLFRLWKHLCCGHRTSAKNTLQPSFSTA